MALWECHLFPSFSRPVFFFPICRLTELVMKPRRRRPDSSAGVTYSVKVQSECKNNCNTASVPAGEVWCHRYRLFVLTQSCENFWEIKIKFAWERPHMWQTRWLKSVIFLSWNPHLATNLAPSLQIWGHVWVLWHQNQLWTCSNTTAHGCIRRG